MKKIKEVRIFDTVGTFAENKDLARSIRIKDILPTLKKGNPIILNFKNVSLTTQSFIHALISQAIRDFGEEALELMQFKDCNSTVKEIVEFVARYMQESLED